MVGKCGSKFRKNRFDQLRHNTKFSMMTNVGQNRIRPARRRPLGDGVAFGGLAGLGRRLLGGGGGGVACSLCLQKGEIARLFEITAPHHYATHTTMRTRDP